jgi:V/A-type H+-transporting ATPase subunit D
MARKIKLTRPELKRQRDALARFTRYLPMLKLKQQQLQISVRDAVKARQAAETAVAEMDQRIESYRPVLAENAGVDMEGLAEPREVRTREENVAGIRVPMLEGIDFARPEYSLFGTPAWVDRALSDLRERSERRARLEVARRRHRRLNQALLKIVQRVNLFEKVLIPEAREAIRVIRIHLGEEQTAAVARSKLAKAKLAEQSQGVLGIEVENGEDEGGQPCQAGPGDEGAGP